MKSSTCFAHLFFSHQRGSLCPGASYSSKNNGAQSATHGFPQSKDLLLHLTSADGPGDCHLPGSGSKLHLPSLGCPPENPKPVCTHTGTNGRCPPRDTPRARCRSATRVHSRAASPGGTEGPCLSPWCPVPRPQGHAQSQPALSCHPAPSQAGCAWLRRTLRVRTRVTPSHLSPHVTQNPKSMQAGTEVSPTS